MLFNCPPPLALYILYVGSTGYFFFSSIENDSQVVDPKKDGNQDDAGLNEEQRTKITVNNCF